MSDDTSASALNMSRLKRNDVKRVWFGAPAGATRLTRYAVLKHGEQARNLVKFPRCETYEKAQCHVEEKDRAFPHGAPHRIVRLDITISEEGEPS